MNKMSLGLVSIFTALKSALISPSLKEVERMARKLYPKALIKIGTD